jgi:2-phosphosulfolactate phosphatase
VRVHVAFTPAEELNAPVAIVVDVLRATSTITQALAHGYERVLCCSEIDEARELAAAQGGLLAGERKTVRIEGFDFGNSPAELLSRPPAETLVLTTTNGTRLLVSAAARCERVYVGSLLNLAAVAAAAADGATEVGVLCAGVVGELALDDAYCAGRIAEALGGERTDSAEAAIRLAATFATPEEGLASSKSAGNLRWSGLDADIAYCARVSALDVVGRFSRMVGDAAEVVAA